MKNDFYSQVKSGDFAKFVSLCEKVAKNSTKEEFEAFLCSEGKELPSVKLGKEDMELLRGGGIGLLKALYYVLKGTAEIIIRKVV